MVLTYPEPWPVDRDGLVSRLVLTAVAATQFVVGLLVALPLAVFTIVAFATAPVVVGVVALLGLVPALAAWTGWQRRVIADLTGRDIPAPYVEPKAPGLSPRLSVWVRDPVRWRDFAHTVFSATGGLAISGIVAVAFVAPISHIVLFLVLDDWSAILFLILMLPTAAVWWFATPYLVQARFAIDAQILGERRTEVLQRRVEQVTRTRAESLDHAAAEVRRIERDLHDGAQARLVALGMNLGLAEELLSRDPDAAATLLAEARASTQSALEDLRSVVREIHPPVLADRGLGGALEALVLDMSVPVTLTVDIGTRLPDPVESAAYFAVAECLANVIKHSAARRAWVTVRHDGERLSVLVGDDGGGGASVEGGTGLRGVARRLAAFDGTIEVDSPTGGPTRIQMEVPCEPLSPKTTPSSEMD